MTALIVAKKWLKANWFSIFASTTAFVLSTCVNQGIDFYKDAQVQNATKAGVINETNKNISAVIRFNNKNKELKDDCRNVKINDSTTRNLLLFPVGLSSEYYLSNAQKVSELNSDLLSAINETYNSQQLLISTIPLVYSGLQGVNKEMESEVYNLYCDYQKKLTELHAKLIK